MRKSDHAAACFEQGFSCSQAVFAALSSNLGLDQETALKISGGFGGGMGHTGGPCGAVTGAIMAIGLKYGKYKAEDTESKAKTHVLVQEFCKRFKARNGSVMCTDLLGHDLSVPGGVEAARTAGAFKAVCPKLVQDAVEIAEEVLRN